MLTLDNDGPVSSIDDLFHEDVASFVSRPLSLPNVLIAEVPEDVLGNVLELESRQIVQDRHRVHSNCTIWVVNTFFWFVRCLDYSSNPGPTVNESGAQGSWLC